MNSGDEGLSEPTIGYELPEPDSGTGEPTRTEMVRDIAVFQGKLLVDGLRDGMLMPVTLAAGVLGLVSKNRRATQVFYDVLRLGMRTERWINLFQPVASYDIQSIRRSLMRLRRSLEDRGRLDEDVSEQLLEIDTQLKELEAPRVPGYKKPNR
ncbi:MAG: hypothetical protein AAFU77_17635 [Myxococcota bacterium]